MKNLITILKKRSGTELIIRNEQDPSDGSISLDLILRDTYTSDELVKLEWVYNLEAGLRELDTAAREIAKDYEVRR